MVIVMGSIAFGPGEIDRLSDGFATHLAKTRAEDGCDYYAFSRDVQDADLMLIAERWRDEAALAAHMATPHMAEFGAVLRGAVVKGTDVKSYDGDKVMTIL